MVHLKLYLLFNKQILNHPKIADIVALACRRNSYPQVIQLSSIKRKRFPTDKVASWNPREFQRIPTWKAVAELADSCDANY